MEYRAPSQQDFAEVESKRQACASQFSIPDLVTSVLRFYNLLITIGHWPLGSLHVAPHENPHIDAEVAKQLNFSASALAVIQSLPYPTEGARYDQECRILELTSILDLTDPEDLERAKFPGRDFDSPPMPGHIFALTLPAADGTTLLFDAELGAIYEEAWHPELSGRHKTPEYRVARYLNGIPETEDWQLFDPGRQARHEYLPFTPAKQWFDKQYERWHGLRRLPFLDPRYEGDRDMNLDEIGPPGDWSRDEYEQKQVAMVALMENLGWPDESKWDREEFVRTWERIGEEFRRKAVQHIYEVLAARGDE